ncbi:MAG: hypothetical protein ACFCVA_03135 [Gammaproteobacteria bacterium]
MVTSFTHETFLRPAEVERHRSTLPASLYNALQLLLTRSQREYVFVPLRGMQYQAVVERQEIIFVDGQGGYAHQDGVGGRLIRIAWQLQSPRSRASLFDPVPYDIVCYLPCPKEEQWRLVSEMSSALEQSFKRQRLPGLGASSCRVIPLSPRR